MNTSKSCCRRFLSKYYFFISRRYLAKKIVTNADRALEYFDCAYPQIYERRWSEIRQSLLKERKYVAVVNNFSHVEDTAREFENLCAFNVGEFYNKKSNAGPEKFDEKMLDKLYGTIKPPSTEIDDSVPQIVKPIDRYPQEFRKQDHTVGDFEFQQSRVLSPSEVGVGVLGSYVDFVPATKLQGLEEWVEETDVFIGFNEADEEHYLKKITPKRPLKWPESLKIYSFVKGDKESRFPRPEQNHSGIYSHFLLDGASVLPVLALDLQPGERVLDMCAAPGGKSLMIWQSLLPGHVVSNDKSRALRISKVLDQFIPKYLTELRSQISITRRDGNAIYKKEMFDKVLVDVPCLMDRHSIHEIDNNIFSTKRLKERLRLPEQQANLLFSALHCVRPGGSVVYSTCTLSPLQNDGSVRLALNKLWKESNIEFAVVDLKRTIQYLKFLFQFGDFMNNRYGYTCIPTADCNFGPMYIAKIRRLA